MQKKNIKSFNQAVTARTTELKAAKQPGLSTSIFTIATKATALARQNKRDHVTAHDLTHAYINLKRDIAKTRDTYAADETYVKTQKQMTKSDQNIETAIDELAQIMSSPEL